MIKSRIKITTLTLTHRTLDFNAKSSSLYYFQIESLHLLAHNPLQLEIIVFNTLYFLFQNQLGIMINE